MLAANNLRGASDQNDCSVVVHSARRLDFELIESSLTMKCQQCGAEILSNGAYGQACGAKVVQAPQRQPQLNRGFPLPSPQTPMISSKFSGKAASQSWRWLAVGSPRARLS